MIIRGQISTASFDGAPRKTTYSEWSDYCGLFQKRRRAGEARRLLSGSKGECNLDLTSAREGISKKEYKAEGDPECGSEPVLRLDRVESGQAEKEQEDREVRSKLDLHNTSYVLNRFAIL